MSKQLNLFYVAPTLAERYGQPCQLDEDFENIRKEQNMKYLLSREKGVK